jgi:hypothetical protein
LSKRVYLAVSSEVIDGQLHTLDIASQRVRAGVVVIIPLWLADLVHLGVD